MLTVLASLTLWACEMDHAKHRRVQMTEIASVALSPTFEPAGGAIADDGRTLLWNEEGTLYLRIESQWRAAEYVKGPGSKGRIHSANCGAKSGAIEYVDDVGLWSWYYGQESAAQVARVPYGKVIGAVAAETWHAITRDDVNNIRVCRLITSWRCVASDPWDSLAGGIRVLAAASDGTVAIIPNMQWQRIAFVGRAGNLLWRDNSVALQSVGHIHVTTGLVGVPGGFLQVVADVTTDERILLYLDRNGRALRSTVLNVPFGVIATASNHQLSLGVRRLDALEVVLYQLRLEEPARARL